MTMADCAANAARIILEVMGRGSQKDGSNDSWIDKEEMYHLVKAQSHLATHIKGLYDVRATDNENHLELALTRLAMACRVRQSKG